MVERRYTVMERSTATQNEVVDCAGRVGAEVLGLQAELDKSDCTNKVSGGLQFSSIALSSPTESHVQRDQLHHCGENDRVHVREVSESELGQHQLLSTDQFPG